MAGLQVKGKDDLNKSLFTKNEEVNKDIYGEKQLESMSKSMSAGYGITPDTQADGGALRPESLDREIKQVTWGSEDFTIYNDIARVPSRSTVEKYIVYYDHGKVGHERFQPEIGLGNQTQPSLKQKTVQMKFLAAPSETSMVLQRSNVVADPIAIQEMGAINVLAKTIEWAIFYGDSDLTKEEAGNGLQFDGLAKLIDKGNVMDWRGKGLTPSLLNQAAVKIGKNGYGVATDAYMPIGLKADFINKFQGAQRILLPTANGMQAGVNIESFLSARGTIRLNGSTIMDLDNVLDESKKPVQGAPLAPSLKAEVVADQGANFLAKDVVEGDDKHVVVPHEVGQDLHYRAVAVGTNGDSQPSDIATAKPANATDGVKLTVEVNALSADAVDYIAIYRQSLIEDSADTFYLVGRIPANKINGNSFEFVDKDEVIAGTADIFILENNPMVLNLFEFLPMTKLNLAIVTNATNFALLWQGALRLSYPKRVVQIKNVHYATGNDEFKF